MSVISSFRLWRLTLVLLTALFLASCGQAAAPVPVSLTPTTTSSPVMLSSVVASAAGREREDCNVQNRASKVLIDEISFNFSNPSGYDLTGAFVEDADTRGLLALVAQCRPDLCRSSYAPFETAFPNACIVEGLPAGRSGRISFYLKRQFRPVETYRFRLMVRSQTPSVYSDVGEGTVVRTPGGSNDRPTLIEFRAEGTRSESGAPYYVGTEFEFYKPYPPGPDEGVEVELSYFNLAGRLFGMTRVTDAGSLIQPVTTLAFGAGVPSALGPPWRITVAVRKTTGSTKSGAQPQSCSDDFRVGQCRTGTIPPSTGTVLSEERHEFVVSNVQ